MSVKEKMRRKQRKFFIGGGLVIAVILWVFWSVGSDNITYYYTPTEILKTRDSMVERRVRVMGLVEDGSIRWQPKTTQLAFRVSDDDGTILSVTYVGSKPDMFKEGQGVVVEGRMGADGVFNATTLMVKHNESYKAAEEAHDKGDYTKTLIN